MADELGYMALMLVWGPLGPTVIQVQDGPSALNLNVRQGTLFAVTNTASGFVFAAFSERDEMDALMEKEWKEHSLGPLVGAALNREAFEAAVARARQVGYAATVGMPIPGITGVSAPVFDESGALALVVTLIGRIHELPVAGDSAPVRGLLKVTAELTRAKPPARRPRARGAMAVAQPSEG
jgi:DNA-binding IclR family transcriptional regulator